MPFQVAKFILPNVFTFFMQQINFTFDLRCNYDMLGHKNQRLTKVDQDISAQNTDKFY